MDLKIDAEALHPVQEKVDAVIMVVVPERCELRSCLGMVQYYHPFLQKIEYKRFEDHANWDTLSRLPH